MKKIVTLMSALLFSMSLFAQFTSHIDPMKRMGTISQAGIINDTISMNTNGPSWNQNWTPLTITDTNGDTIVYLADTLASGKSVLICFFSPGCSPALQLHQMGNFIAIHNQLGTQVSVIWINIYGYVPPDFIVDTNGNPVPYRVVGFIPPYGSGIGDIPDVFFVAPNGYYSHIYPESWGLSLNQTSAEAVSNIQTLLNSYPRANSVPTVRLSGACDIIVGESSTYNASVYSIDSITNTSWIVTGGTISTLYHSPHSATVTWDSSGIHYLIYTVTNTTGSTSDTMIVNVRPLCNSNNDTINYCGDGQFINSVGYYGDGEIYWGIKIPVECMSGRNYLSDVSLYIHAPGNYEMFVYEDIWNDQNLLYSHTYNYSDTGRWERCTIYETVSLDTNKALLIFFHCVGVNYPAAFTHYGGYPNGSLYYCAGCYGWETYPNGSWMIKVTTSTTPPPLTIGIDGPTVTQINTPVTFIAQGPSSAQYNWILQGATPNTGIGDSISVSWHSEGVYNIILLATMGTQSSTDTLQINVFDSTSSSFTVFAMVNDSTMGYVLGGGDFIADTAIMLSAIPLSHYHFSSWAITDVQGSRTSTINPLLYTVVSNATITANFETDVYTINAIPNNVDYGEIVGSGRYEYLDTVTLSATPFNGYHFNCWNNGVTENPYAFLATEDLNITAIFVSDEDTTTQFFTILVRPNDSSMGTAMGGGTFYLGATTTLAAIPNEGYRFVQWQDANSENPRTIIVTANAEYIAYFEANVGIADADGEPQGPKVYTDGGKIVVTDAEGEEVCLYDIMGRRIVSRQEDNGPVVIDVPAAGVYLVRIGDRAARKVVVVQ